MENQLPSTQPINNSEEVEQATPQPIKQAPKNPLMAILIVFGFIAFGVAGYFIGANSVEQVGKDTPSEIITEQADVQQKEEEKKQLAINELVWASEEWHIPGNFTESPVPNATYQISLPETWNINKKISEECFLIEILDPTSSISIEVQAICDGWSGNEDRITLPANYKIVKKSKGVLNGDPDFKYLARINNSENIFAYVGGRNSIDQVGSAHFTNAVMVSEDISERDVHSYFKPSNISVSYSGKLENQEKYLKVVDKIIASLKIKNVNYER